MILKMLLFRDTTALLIFLQPYIQFNNFRMGSYRVKFINPGTSAGVHIDIRANKVRLLPNSSVLNATFSSKLKRSTKTALSEKHDALHLCLVENSIGAAQACFSFLMGKMDVVSMGNAIGGHV